MQTDPLFEAVMLGDLETVERLLDEGADIDAQDEMGETPLMAAVSARLPMEEMLRRFRIQQEAEQKTEEKTPDNASMLDRTNAQIRAAAKTPRKIDPELEAQRDAERAAREDDTTMVALLLSRGANVNLARGVSVHSILDGVTPLHQAANAGHPQTTRLLLEYGADIEARDAEGRTPLYHAVEERNWNLANLLLERGADPHTRTEGGTTLLMAVARSANLGFAQTLLDRGLDVNAYTATGTTALAVAAMRPRLEMVAWLQAAGALVGFLEAVALGDLSLAESLPDDTPPRTPRWGHTLLQWAVSEGHLDRVRLLCQRGANVNEVDMRGRNPLLTAAMRGNIELVRLLLEAGADPNITNPTGFTPLRWASNFGYEDMVRLLLEYGADVHAADKDRFTPLINAVTHNHLETARILLDAGADPNAAVNKQMSALYLALSQGRTEMARLLIERGADATTPYVRKMMSNPAVQQDAELKTLLQHALGDDLDDAIKADDAEAVEDRLREGRAVNVAGSRGQTPLHFAAKEGKLKVARLLLEQGAEIDKTDEYGFTPLLKAIAEKQTEVARFLIERGADISIPNQWGQTPMHRALLSDNTELVTLLKEAGAPIRLVEAALLQDHATVSQLLDWGTDIDTTDEAGMTALMAFAVRGDLEGAQRLLTRGANLHLRDKRGVNALRWAVQWKRHEMVALLLEAGAEVNAIDDAHQTALHDAAVQRDVEIIRLLFRYGADPNATRKNGESVLHFAVFLPDPTFDPVVQALLEGGADPNTEFLQESPLRRAAENGRLEAVRLLLDAGADVNAAPEFGGTALSIALRKGHADIAKLLRDRGAVTRDEAYSQHIEEIARRTSEFLKRRRNPDFPH